MVMKKTKYYFKEYFIFSILFLLPYRFFLLKNIYGFTVFQSVWILLFIIIVFSIINYYIYINIESEDCITYGSLLAFGTYTAISYYHLLYKFINIIFVICITVGIILSIVILFRKKRNKTKKIIKKRILKSVLCLELCFAIGIGCTIGKIFIDKFFYSTAYTYEVHTNIEQLQTDTFENNIDRLCLLKETKWIKLNTKEKLEILQVVLNIEANYLGLNKQLIIDSSDLKENTIGNYQNQTSIVTIDAEYLNEEHCIDVVEVCFHEAYHAYQYFMIDQLKKNKIDPSNTYLYNKVSLYLKETEHYKCEDGYYYQNLEIDARSYADGRIDNYRRELSKLIDK